jgi:serine-type D-Ala-D-Ala carboxypeptidase (penicillin-binding protein 5/6)
MKTLPVLFLLVLCSANHAFAQNPLSRYMSGGKPHTVSEYTALMDVNTGQVLYSENMFSHREPASLTKMAAAIVLIEHGKLTDTVTAPDGLNAVPESSLHLSKGEQISLHDMLYAMLLRSANDTPVAGAYYLCGSIPPFVALMNQTVRQIGCGNTNFVTPNGLYAPGHYSCAYDLALIARYAETHLPFFRQVVKTHIYKVTRSIHKDDSVVINTASTFLADFPGADGVKTGYISQAGHCFVGSATRNGWQLIAVALNSPRCRSDVVQLLSYGFANFRPRLVYPAGYLAGTANLQGRRVAVKTAGALWDVIPSGVRNPALKDYTMHLVTLLIPATQSITSGERVGVVTLSRNGRAIMTVDADAVAASPGDSVSAALPLNSSKKLIRSLLTVLALIVVAPILYISAKVLDIALHARKIAKNSRRRWHRLPKNIGGVDTRR